MRKQYSTPALLLALGISLGISFGTVYSVSAAGTSAAINLCVNKTTSVVTQKPKCSKNERVLSISKTGVPGPKGSSGLRGLPGLDGSDGAQGPSGAPAPTVTEPNCIGFRCTYKIGDVGPGGGIIYFVDYNDIYAGINYLEVAPAGWGVSTQVNRGGNTLEIAGSEAFDPAMKWCSDFVTLQGPAARMWSNSAVGQGSVNTQAFTATDQVTRCQGGAMVAAAEYEGGGKTDWFLPSIGEAMLLYSNLRPLGVGLFETNNYWTSSETHATAAWLQFFDNGRQGGTTKDTNFYVRPVRAF
jgi:hypothetical protein